MSSLLKVIGFIALLPLIVFLNGWAASVLWKWFVVPVFDLPLLGVMEAVGIALVVYAFTPTRYNEEDSNDEPAKKIFVGITLPILLVGIGWIYTLFL